MTFDKDTLASIGSSLKAGHYNLLLGSGVSLDSQNDKGPLLSGNDFRLALCQLKKARENSPLQRVYSTLTPAEIKEHVIKRFVNCRPGPSVQKISQFIWRRIFTFNIDDALENAYSRPNLLQNPTPFHFDDGYADASNLEDLPIVHLHGWVGTPDRGFVFSRDEYVRHIKSINPWMVLLTQFLRVEPFIIAGTSLDEVDLDYYLAHRTEATAREDRGPSILVEPNPDAVTENDCRRYGLRLFPGTTEQFLDYLSANFPDRPTPIELIPQETRRLLPAAVSKAAALSFAGDFELVPGTAGKSDTLPRFLYGHTPSWQDIESNIDIERSITLKTLNAVESALKNPASNEKIILILDDTGGGKTTTIRRCAYEFAKRGIKTIICSALSRIEPLSTSSIIDLIDGPLVIVVDNFADQVTVISELVQRLEKKDVVILCAERRYRQRYIAQSLLRGAYAKIEGEKLRPIDAERLINLYLEFGVLGSKEAVKDRKKFSQSILSDPIAVACCRIMNDFRPLERIVESLSEATPDTDFFRYLVSAVAQHCYRAGVRNEILVAIASRDGWQEQFGGSHPLPLAYFDERARNFIVPENATLASGVLTRTQRSNPELLLRAFIELANAIAPRVNPQAVRMRTAEARLAGRLFDFDQITSELLGNLSGAFYAETQAAWQWNSRYWAQVSLMNLARYFVSPSSPEGREALNHAVQRGRQAVAIETHPLPLTTLGKILLTQMTQPGVSLSETYNEAYDRLVASIDIERSWLRVNVHPFITLFRGTREYLRNGGALSGQQAEHLRLLLRQASAKFPRDNEIQDEILQLTPMLK